MDNILKIQCPHCQAIYKCPVNQPSRSQQARCAHCQNSFPIQTNLLPKQKTPAKKSTATTPQSKNTKTKKIKPIAQPATIANTNLSSQTFFHQEDNNSAVAIIAYDEVNNDDSNWLEDLFNEPEEKPQNLNKSDNQPQLNNTAHTQISIKKTKKPPVSTSPVTENQNVEQTEIWPSDFIEDLNNKVNQNQADANHFSDNDTENSYHQNSSNSDSATLEAAVNEETTPNQTVAVNTENHNRGAINDQQQDTVNNDFASEQGQPTTNNHTATSTAATTTDSTKNHIADSNKQKNIAKDTTSKKISKLYTASSKTDKAYTLTSTNDAQHAVNRRPIYASLFWIFGCLALLLLLLAQYVIFNLDNLIKSPSSEKRLVLFCHAVSCSLPSADLQNIAITNQTLRPSSLKVGGTDILAALVNNSNQEQLYPNLHVRIYQDKTLLGEFIATPHDYLTVQQRLLGRKQVKLFMLSVDIPHKKITQVDITPLY